MDHSQKHSAALGRIEAASVLEADRPRWSHPGIAFGCDYNPEQWDRSVWAEDIALMRSAGVDLVAINIFGWADLQDADGSIDTSDLDEIIELLHAAGIRVNLGTGTASPPPWLTTRHPEVLPVMADGTRRNPGGRQAWCPSSLRFREAALRLVDAVASRYGSHPAVAVWHVSNELGCHNAHCHCPVSAAAFRRWLRRRYSTVEALNRSWGTSFWSQRYRDWEEIGTPMATVSTRNPAQVLDYRRFSSDELLDYYRAETAVIRQHSAAPVTTNFMVTAHINALDYWRWAPDVDVVANDHYLDHRLPSPPTELSFSADLTRGLAGGAPWLLMEQAAGAVNWQPHNLAKEPGEMLRNSLTHVARGADAVCFFQWRASVQGAEKFHSALLPHSGTEAPAWRETQELGALLGRLGDVAGTRVRAEVAMIFSWEAWWAFDGENRPTEQIGYLDQVHAAYAAFRACGVTVDLVPPGSDLSGYRLIVVPGLWLVSDSDARRLDTAVAGGAHVLVGYGSGIVDEDDRVRTGGYGAWNELLGIRVDEFAPLAPHLAARLASGGSVTAWAERMRVTDAEVVDTFETGPAAGRPAVTRRAGRQGAGDAWYVGAHLDPTTFTALVQRVLAGAGVHGEEGASADVEIIRRDGPDRTFSFVINHGDTDVTVVDVGHELVTGTDADGLIIVPAGSVRVVRSDRP